MSGFAESIIHVDMDAFFVECERLDDPTLVGRPVLVGGGGPRGVVASASYEARAAGARSAMPMSQALRMCPDAIVVPPRHHRYREVSAAVFDVFRSFTPLVEGLSVDEAFLDVAGLHRHHRSAVDLATALRRQLRDDLGLPASAGIASNKLLAKLASEQAKPDGQRHIPIAEQIDFLHGLPVGALWGVGEATRAALDRLGVVSVGDLASVPESTLRRALGAAQAAALHRLAAGEDDRPVLTESEAKSVSVEVTYDQDLVDADRIHVEVVRLADQLSGRLRRAGLAGRTVTLKVRFADFTTITRSVTLASATDVSHDLRRAADGLLDRAAVAGRPVRLVGVGASALVTASEAPRQLATDRPAKWDDLADAVDEVRDRFGTGAVAPASVARSEKARRHRSGTDE